MAQPLAAMLASTAKGQYKCPEAVIRMRAAVARLKPVRLLRPQVSDKTIRARSQDCTVCVSAVTARIVLRHCAVVRHGITEFCSCMMAFALTASPRVGLQALPVKLLALGAFTGVVNLPSGVARVHVEKFSPGWLVAVSAVMMTLMLHMTALR